MSWGQKLKGWLSNMLPGIGGPAQVSAPVRLQDRVSLFGLCLCLPPSEVLAAHGPPLRRVEQPTGSVSWYYTEAQATVEVRVYFMRPPAWATKRGVPADFQLAFVSVGLTHPESPDQWKDAIRELQERGWDDPLLDDLGSTRAEVRARYGDPDRDDPDGWSYPIKETKGSLSREVIRFTFSENSESAVCAEMSLREELPGLP